MGIGIGLERLVQPKATRGPTDAVTSARAELHRCAAAAGDPFRVDALDLKAIVEKHFGKLSGLEGAPARSALEAFSGFLGDLAPEARTELRPSVLRMQEQLERAASGSAGSRARRGWSPR